MHYYNYTVTDTSFDVRQLAATSLRIHYEVSFPTPRPTSWQEGNTVYGDFFVPQTVKRVPLVILVHGFGDESVFPCLMMARLLVKQEIAAFVLYLTIHSRRLPEAMKESSLPPTSQGWFETYQSSVTEICRIVDWASGREEIDPKKICVAGISLGGMISSIAMAVDERIFAGFFIVIGGNLEELSWGGKSGAIPVGHACTREECHTVYRQYPAYLDEVKKKGLENAVPAKECFLYDPLTFANYLRGRPILMINAKEDEVVSEHSTLNLWEAYGRPRLVWLPVTHAGVYSQSALINTEITNFLNCQSHQPD